MTKERISLEESAASVRRIADRLKDFKPEETRGVQKGTKRGKYKPRKKGVIKDKNFIIAKCKQCRQEFTYKREGKRLREYCSEKCKQKFYRQNKTQKEIQRKQQLLR